MNVNDFIFREYDIRGEVAVDFPEEVVVALGKAFATIVKRRGGKKITLSGDVRLTTPQLKEYFKAGALSTGVDVMDIGILPTPGNYFSVFHFDDVDGACQITGSHNPPEFNGFKLTFNQLAFFGQDIQDMLTLIKNDDFELGEGVATDYDLLPEYMDTVVKGIDLKRPMRIVVDAGNAAAALCEIDVRLGNAKSPAWAARRAATASGRD